MSQVFYLERALIKDLDITPVLLSFPILSSLCLQCDNIIPALETLHDGVNVHLQDLKKITFQYVPGMSEGSFWSLADILVKKPLGLADFQLVAIVNAVVNLKNISSRVYSQVPSFAIH